MIRVGMVLPLEGMWMGGQHYFHNLLSCCRQYPDKDVRLEVFTERPRELARHECDNIHIHECPIASLAGRWHWPRRAINWTLRYDPLLLRVMERNGIEVVSHFSIGWQRTVNTLLWQPDFQHRIFPGFFTRRNQHRRDTYVRSTALWGNILLSSQAAVDDFRRFFPELASVRTHILHFCSAAALDIEPMSRAELAAQYPVQQPYFHLPNQFWKHKNHEVIVDALQKTAPEIRVICTGEMNDSRHPEYVPALLEKVKAAGMEQRFVCLGALPYRTMVSLMHHSIAVLQPSLFEGWSTTVEESKAMGKRIVLSGIDVHREQAPERGLYFSPASPDELADSMERVYREFSPEEEERFAGRRGEYEARIGRELSESYAAIVTQVAAPR
jgi:glycosyltransferase involved in cell wall biosynthesis